MLIRGLPRTTNSDSRGSMKEIMKKTDQELLRDWLRSEDGEAYWKAEWSKAEELPPMVDEALFNLWPS